MTPRLVFVHGVGGARDAVADKDEWLRALAEGARAAGHSRRASELVGGSVDVRFAYYGDLFPGNGEPAADVAELLLDVVDERLVDPRDDREAQVLRRARAQIAPEGQQQGVGSAVRHLFVGANTLMALPGLRTLGGWASGRVMVHRLGQVTDYLRRGHVDDAGLSIDRRIRDRVAAELDPVGPTVVVAHSLGSVVAFETLHEHAGAVPLLVTVGSPIGMRTVVRARMRPQPLHVPAGVGRWLNFWDRDDVIVGRPELERCIAANAAAVAPVSRRVDSDGAWVHPAAKYLAQPGVAGPVVEALEAATVV
ncbi:alpha/beta hydrolase [Streptomyces sp. NPDC050803]|uniref:alpha/beta hydrolase n=1 Tax=unclassified Streptomyces TaxID=2593676 RepID=UPI0034471EC2